MVECFPAQVQGLGKSSAPGDRVWGKSQTCWSKNIVHGTCSVSLWPGFSNQQCVYVLSHSFQFTNEEKENNLPPVNLRLRNRSSQKKKVVFFMLLYHGNEVNIIRLDGVKFTMRLVCYHVT